MTNFILGWSYSLTAVTFQMLSVWWATLRTSLTLLQKWDFLPGGYVFTGVCLFNFGGSTPSQVWGDTPSRVWMVGGRYPIPGWGVPHPGLDGGVPKVPPPARSGWQGGTWGTPHHHDLAGVPLSGMGYPTPPTRQSSIASSYYVARGMPLAFT